MGCKSRAREWEDRSKARTSEIEAIAMAVKILGKLTGVRTEAPSNPGLPAKSSMIQRAAFVDPKKQAIELLRSTAKTVHSKALERLAVEVSNHLNGPFADVNSMIQKMIFRLQAEQTKEVTHKTWCDKELSNTQASKDDKTGKVEELGAKLNELDSGVAVLSNDITAADKRVADITRVMQEATEIRQTGKQENKVSLKDAEDAQAGLAKAVSVMQQFYAESGSPKESEEAVALPKSPKLWDAGYTAVADPKNADTNVIAILETVAADFAMMEAKTKAQEVAEEKEFQDQISANKIELARRRSESTQKVQTKQRKVTKSSMLNKQKKHVNSELDAVKQYSKDLKPACVDGDSSFEDRKAARDKEIKALRDSQVLLQNAFAEKKGKFLQISSHR